MQQQSFKSILELLQTAAKGGPSKVDTKEMVKAGVRGAASGAVYQGLWNYAAGSGAGRTLYNSKGDLSPGKAQKSIETQKIQANIGNKMNYLFGKATGSPHNVARSVQMSGQLNSVGIYNNATGREIIKNSLNNVLNDPSSVIGIQNNGRVIRESLLVGPIPPPKPISPYILSSS